jgi:hypothetical protein
MPANSEMYPGFMSIPSPARAVACWLTGDHRTTNDSSTTASPLQGRRSLLRLLTPFGSIAVDFDEEGEGGVNSRNLGKVTTAIQIDWLCSMGQALELTLQWHANFLNAKKRNHEFRKEGHWRS